MVLGIEYPELESTSASKMVAKHSENLTNSDETNIGNDGASIPEAGHNQYEALEVVNSPPLVVAEASSPSSSPAAIRGKGLKKWRRIKRDASLEGVGNLDNSRLMKRGLSNFATNLSKPVKFSAEQAQASEGPASSSNAIWKNFIASVDHFGGNDDSGLVVGPNLGAGTDSDNSEYHSSKSTAASAPKMRLDSREKIKMKNVTGKKLASSLPKGHQGKPQTDTSKKLKGEQVKIEKENSHSSLESDSRTSYLVYGQGKNSATINGRQCEKSMISGEGTSDEAHGGEHELSEEPQTGSSRKNGAFEVTSAEKSGVDCSWAAKDDRSENNSSPRDLDPLVESILLLRSVQQDLEKEVEKFRVIGKEEIWEQLDCDELVEESVDVHLVLDEVNIKGDEGNYIEDMENEVERMLKQKIEAEVEVMGITKTVQKMRGAVGEQIKILEQAKNKQVKMVEKIEDVGEKTEKLKGRSEKLEAFIKDMVNTEELLKLRSSVWKYASCFIMQLVVFVIMVAVFFWQLDCYPVDFVPT